MLNQKYTTTRKLTDYVKPAQRIANTLSLEHKIAKRQEAMRKAYTQKRVKMFYQG